MHEALESRIDLLGGWVLRVAAAPRVARGFQPKAVVPKAPIDPNAPNLTAGQKATLARAANIAAKNADPNFVPPKKSKAAAKAPAKKCLDAAIGAAFPVEPATAAAVEAVA